MEYRLLGQTGIEASVIAFGCGPSAGLMVNGTEAEQDAAIGRALELGVTLFDTASVYGHGTSETNLGASLGRLSDGDKAVVASKFLIEWADVGNVAKAVVRSVHDTLERLGRERVDVFQMHNRVAVQPEPGQEFAIGPMLSVSQVLSPGGIADALEALIDDGLVGAVGFTTYGGEPHAIEQLIDSGRFGMINGEFNMLQPSALHTVPEGFDQPDYGQVMARAAANGMGVAVIRALAGGALVEAAHDVHPLAEARTRNPEHAENVRRGAAVRRTLASDERPLEHVAINYVLSHPEVTTVVLGFSSAAQVEESVRAVSPDGVRWDTPAGTLEGLYATGFGQEGA